MREILFRGKGFYSDEWVEGYLAIGTRETDNAKEYAIIPVDVIFWEYGVSDLIQVIPETICQYTGLTDKNGNKIWENDVVFVTDGDGNSGSSDTGVGEIDFLLGLWYVSGSIQNGLYDVLEVIGHEAEVIGNIFDNPELLERN